MCPLAIELCLPDGHPFVVQNQGYYLRMDPRKLFVDERLLEMCAYCGGQPDTRDHVPSRVLLDDLDLFGVRIEEKDVYYKRDRGGFGNDVKLSQQSMDRICVAVLFDNRLLASLSDKILSQRRQKMEDIIRKLSEEA